MLLFVLPRLVELANATMRYDMIWTQSKTRLGERNEERKHENNGMQRWSLMGFEHLVWSFSTDCVLYCTLGFTLSFSLAASDRDRSDTVVLLQNEQGGLGK